MQIDLGTEDMESANICNGINCLIHVKDGF